MRRKRNASAKAAEVPIREPIANVEEAGLELLLPLVLILPGLDTWPS
jgi:hypothetical protein